MDIDAINTRFDGLEKLLEEKFNNVNTHLEDLNGAVSKNTAFRQKGVVIIAILGTIGIASVSTLIGIGLSRLFN